jgi:hypothetical protein
MIILVVHSIVIVEREVVGRQEGAITIVSPSFVSQSLKVVLYQATECLKIPLFVD